MNDLQWSRKCLPVRRSRQDRQILTFGVGMLALGAALAVLVLLGSCKASPMKIAGTTVRALQQGRDLAGKQLAATIRAKHAECKTTHGAKTPGFAACVKDVLAAQDLWRKYIRPAIDTSADVANTALKTTAFVNACKKAKDCHKRVIAFLRKGYCAASRWLRSFGHLLSDKGQAVLGTFTSFQGVICE